MTTMEGKRQAKFNVTLTLPQLMAAIKKNLSLKGRAYIIYRSAFLSQLFHAAAQESLSITSIQGVEDIRLPMYKSCILILQHGEHKTCQFVRPITL